MEICLDFNSNFIIVLKKIIKKKGYLIIIMINVCIINAKVSQCYCGIDQFAVITNCSNEVNDGCVVSINIYLRDVCYVTKCNGQKTTCNG